MEDLTEKLQNLRRTIECPVCLSLPESTPIYQCENGHIICKSCRQSIETCPQCCKPLAYNRSLVAESFLEAFSKPCPFVKHGCDAKILPDHEEGHKKTCAYREVHCPIKVCGKRVSIHNVISHLQSEHNKKVSSSGLIRYTLSRIPDSVNWISLENQDFLVVRKKPHFGHWHFWIYGLGTPDQMAKFSYQISISNEDGSSKISEYG